MHEHAGRSCYDQGRYIEACNHFEKALELRKVEDPDLIARTELALDAVFNKVAQNGWGPYPRSRDEILQVHRPPVPTFSEKVQRWGYADAGRRAGDRAELRRRAAVPRRRGLGTPTGDADLGADRRDRCKLLIDASAGYLGVGSFSDGLAWVSPRRHRRLDRHRQDQQGGDPDRLRRCAAVPARASPPSAGAAGARSTGPAGSWCRPGTPAFATALTDGRYVDGFTDEGLAIVDAGGRKGVVDRTGKVIVPPAHPALVIHPVAFLIGDGAGRWGALDRRGEPLIDVVHPSRAEVHGGDRPAAGGHQAGALSTAGVRRRYALRARVGAWNSDTSAAPACWSARSRTATGSPTAPRSRRRPRSPASGPPSTCGITTFDTADVYAGTRAEEVLGRALKGERREGLEIFTKVYWPTGPGRNDRGLSRKHIMESINGSLRRLQTDYVDLYQAHRYDYATPLEETMEAFADIVHSGKALYIGVSEWTAERDPRRRTQLARELKIQLVSNQPQYSMLWRVIEAEVVPTSEELGIGQIVWSPIAQGVLTGKYLPGQPPPAGSRATDEKSGAGFIARFMTDEVLTRVQQLKPLAEQAGLTMAQLAVAWVLQNPNVSSAIIGASRPEQVHDNVKAAGVKLDADLLKAIDEILEPIVERDPAKTRARVPAAP